MLTNIKAAIFDLDGTLIDSMGVWREIDIKFLEERNLELPETLKKDLNTMSFESVAIYFKELFNLQESVEEIKGIWLTMALEIYPKLPLKPGAREFLLHLKNSGIKLGLATSNTTVLLEAVLKSNAIYDLFDSITITHEVNRSKCFPDVYLLAAKKLEVSPENCLVFEDLLLAVKGAKSANMTVVCVQDDHAGGLIDDLKSESDFYIESYEKLLDSLLAVV
ncbi:MAG: HAD family phosphatase [Clostridium sp.]